MLVYVLGAPGAGKSATADVLREQLPGHVVFDWDAFLEPAGELAGRPVNQAPEAWGPYRRLVSAVVNALSRAAVPAVIFGVGTPDELEGWPIDAWLLLDCDDQERRRRLFPRGDPGATEVAILDAKAYRELRLPVVDTTNRGPIAVAERVASFVSDVSARARARA